MIDLITARPRPVPFPALLVVKKGSNIFLRTSREIPGPLSSTVAITFATQDVDAATVLILATLYILED